MVDVCPALLADVKNYLDITWEDEATDRKVSGIIASGMKYLSLKGGSCLDFSKGLPNQLLKDYVRYTRDSALDVFENNYRSLILTLQLERKVIANVENAEQA